MSDGSFPLGGWAFEGGCMLLFALLLQLPISQRRSFRYATGTVISTLMLLVPPCMYSTASHFLAQLAVLSALLSWCTLYWTFVEPLHREPSVVEVFFSSTIHSIQGAVKVHKRFLQDQSGAGRLPTKPTNGVQHRAESSQRQQQPVSSWTELQHSAKLKQQQQQQQQSVSLWSLLFDAVTTLLLVHIACDVGLHLLCSFSNGMCSSTTSIPSWLGMPTKSSGPQQQGLTYLARCPFAFAAGMLLTQQVEAPYCTLRLGLILAAFRWPSLTQLVAAMPPRAFNWPIAAKSVGEFWSLRWHQALRLYFEGLGRAATNLILPNCSASTAVRDTVRCLFVFAMSGLVHEYIIWAGFGLLTWCHMAFFMLNGMAVIMERLLLAVLRPRMYRSQLAPAGPRQVSTALHPAAYTVNGSTVRGTAAGVREGLIVHPKVLVGLQRAWTISFFFLVSPLFVEPCRAAGVFAEHALHLFGAPVTPRVLAAAHDCTAFLRG